MSKFQWPRLRRGSSRRWFAGVDKTRGRILALNAEITFFRFSVGEESETKPRHSTHSQLKMVARTVPLRGTPLCHDWFCPRGTCVFAHS